MARIFLRYFREFFLIHKKVKKKKKQTPKVLGMYPQLFSLLGQGCIINEGFTLTYKSDHWFPLSAYRK